MARALATLLMGLATVACSSDGTSDDDAALRMGREAVVMSSGRCEMVEREGGPCILWGPSIVELIARPELYDQKRVRVIGFVNFEFEGNGIYLSREDWRQGIARNGLWINPPNRLSGGSPSPPAIPNQRYVLVEATFRARLGGHFGMWSGTLDSVTRIQPWGPDSAPRAKAP